MWRHVVSYPIPGFFASNTVVSRARSLVPVRAVVRVAELRRWYARARTCTESHHRHHHHSLLIPQLCGGRAPRRQVLCAARVVVHAAWRHLHSLPELRRRRGAGVVRARPRQQAREARHWRRVLVPCTFLKRRCRAHACEPVNQPTPIDQSHWCCSQATRTSTARKSWRRRRSSCSISTWTTMHRFASAAPARFVAGVPYHGWWRQHAVLSHAQQTVCKLCWAFIAAAVKLLNTALRGMHRCNMFCITPTSLTPGVPRAKRACDIMSTEQFGFEHLLFVFSGRRGVHCWVADTAARQLSDRGRKAVVRYLSIVVRIVSDRCRSSERARERESEHSPTRLPQTKDDNRISVSRNPHPFLQYVLLGSANHALRWRTNRMSLVS